jgi:hypothetical protein
MLYIIQRFITTFRTACHLFPPKARWIQYTPSHSSSIKFMANIHFIWLENDKHTLQVIKTSTPRQKNIYAKYIRTVPVKHTWHIMKKKIMTLNICFEIVTALSAHWEHITFNTHIQSFLSDKSYTALNNHICSDGTHDCILFATEIVVLIYAVISVTAINTNYTQVSCLKH